MKAWMICVLVAVVCWGSYVPMVHHGANAFEMKHGSFRAFLFVGLSYFIMAGAILLYICSSRIEPFEMTSKGVALSTVAGLLGAAGALGVIFAVNRFGGSPLYVAPLVFAGAPVVNTLVSMAWDRPGKAPHPLFYVGIILAAAGAGLVLGFKPGPGGPSKVPRETASVAPHTP
jgi:hypothetical protein